MRINSAIYGKWLASPSLSANSSHPLNFYISLWMNPWQRSWCIFLVTLYYQQISIFLQIKPRLLHWCAFLLFNSPYHPLPHDFPFNFIEFLGHKRRYIQVYIWNHYFQRHTDQELPGFCWNCTEYPPVFGSWFNLKLSVESPNGRNTKFPKSFSFPEKKNIG